MNKQALPDGWNRVALGDIGVFSKGYGITKDDLEEGGVPCIRYGELYTKHNVIVKKAYSYATRRNISKYKLIKPNDLLFAGSGETREEIGRCASFNHDAKVYAGGDVIIYSPDSKVLLSDFVSYYLNTIGRNQLNRLGQGDSIVHIYGRDLSKVVIPIPPLPEQKAIAETLQTWDTAIEKTEALIAAKERQFRWLQKSLMDKDYSSYSSHLSEYAGIMEHQKIEEVGQLKLLTVRLHCKGIGPNERDVQIILSNKGRPYFQRFTGQFLIGRQNFHNGGFGIVPSELDGFIASNAITTLDINEMKLDSKYLFYFFSRKDYYLRISHIMDGTGQKELSDKQIMNLPVSIPDLSKQKEVVVLLDIAQNEINLLKKQAEYYRTQKRGLMQKLLIGKWQL